jgi:hypothetical protein
MIRWGVRLVLLAVPLFVAGFAGASSWWFEAARLAGAGFFALGVLLLLVDHLWAGDSEGRELTTEAQRAQSNTQNKDRTRTE